MKLVEALRYALRDGHRSVTDFAENAWCPLALAVKKWADREGEFFFEEPNDGVTFLTDKDGKRLYRFEQ